MPETIKKLVLNFIIRKLTKSLLHEFLEFQLKSEKLIEQQSIQKNIVLETLDGGRQDFCLVTTLLSSYTVHFGHIHRICMHVSCLNFFLYFCYDGLRK